MVETMYRSRCARIRKKKEGVASIDRVFSVKCAISDRHLLRARGIYRAGMAAQDRVGGLSAGRLASPYSRMGGNQKVYRPVYDLLKLLQCQSASAAITCPRRRGDSVFERA